MSDARSEALDAAAVTDALRELRPDPESFRAGLARRIADLEDDERGRAERIARSPFLRSAAALLPATWLPAGLAPKVASQGLALTPRDLLTLLLYPALAFFWLAVPFLIAFGAIAERGRHREGMQWDELLGWWRERKRGAFLTLLVVGAIFWIDPATGAAALVLVSTATLLLLLSHLRAAGFDNRRDVGRRCAFFLTALAVFFTRVPLEYGGIHPLWNDAAWAAVAAGALVTSFLAIAAVHRSVWSFLTRCDGVEVALGLVGVVLVAFLAGVVAAPLLVGSSLSEVIEGEILAHGVPWRPRDLVFVASWVLLSVAAIAATLRAPLGGLAKDPRR